MQRNFFSHTSALCLLAVGCIKNPHATDDPPVPAAITAAPTATRTPNTANVSGQGNLPSFTPPPDATAVPTAQGPAYRYEKVLGKGGTLHLVTVDLTSPAVSLHVSSESEGRTTPRMFAQKVNAAVAINGDFFDTSKAAMPLGLSMSDGVTWAGTQVQQDWFVFACDRFNACLIKSYSKTEPTPWWNVIGGRDHIVKQGVAWDSGDDNSCPSLCAVSAPRTAIALTENGKTLLIGVAEGYAETAGGLRVSALAQWLTRSGAYEAINLDGGGSAQLIINGQLVTRRPDNEPAERPVANMLGIIVRQ